MTTNIRRDPFKDEYLPITDTATFEEKANKGVANGYAPLNGNAKVDRSFIQVPGHEVQDEGVTATDRLRLNFTGTAVSVNDNPGNDSIDVVVNALGGPTPLTMESSLLSSVVSHWRFHSGLIGGATIPDLVGSNTLTKRTGILGFHGYPDIGARRFDNNLVWGHDLYDIANPLSFPPAMRDNNWSILAWVNFQDNALTGTNAFFFIVGGSGEAQANNVNGAIRLPAGSVGHSLVDCFWERGGGVDEIFTIPRISEGIHHIAVTVEHDVPVAGNSQLTFYLDGVQSFQGNALRTNGGTGAGVVAGFGDNPAAPGGRVGPLMFAEMIFTSGTLPSPAQIKAQADRGWFGV